MLDMYDRLKTMLHQDKSRLPQDYLSCLKSQLHQLIRGYMDISNGDLVVSMEYLSEGGYLLTMRVVGERLSNYSLGDNPDSDNKKPAVRAVKQLKKTKCDIRQKQKSKEYIR